MIAPPFPIQANPPAGAIRETLRSRSAGTPAWATPPLPPQPDDSERSFWNLNPVFRLEIQDAADGLGEGEWVALGAHAECAVRGPIRASYEAAHADREAAYADRDSTLLGQTAPIVVLRTDGNDARAYDYSNRLLPL